MCFRHGSSSLVEMSQYRTLSLTNTRNPSSSLSPSQNVASPNSADEAVHATDSPQNPPLLSHLLPPNQHFHHDSACHFNSPHLQPHWELRMSVLHSPQPPHHCKTCMSLLLSNGRKEGRSLGCTHLRSLSASPEFTSVSPISPHLARSCPATLTPHLSSPPSPMFNSKTTLVTLPAHCSPSPQVVLPSRLYGGGDLTLLNQCLHHIISRRTSSPTLSANHPVPDHGVTAGVTASSVVGHIERPRQNVPNFSSPNLDRDLLLSPYDREGRPDQLVGQRGRFHVG